MPQKCATILEWECEVSTNNVLTEQASSFLVVVGTTIFVFNINHHGYAIHLLFLETIPSLSICSLLAKCMAFFIPGRRFMYFLGTFFKILTLVSLLCKFSSQILKQIYSKNSVPFLFFPTL